MSRRQRFYGVCIRVSCFLLKKKLMSNLPTKLDLVPPESELFGSTPLPGMYSYSLCCFVSKKHLFCPSIEAYSPPPQALTKKPSITSG